MPDFLQRILSPERLIPHGHCYLWDPTLVWLHSASDTLIAVAYFSIPFALWYFVRRRPDIVFRPVFIAFGVFILTCGLTHVLSVWTIWHPAYWLLGWVKAVTALSSIATAAMLWPLIPKAIGLPSPASLAAANRELEREVAERRRVESMLRANEERLRVALMHAPVVVYNQDRDLRYTWTHNLPPALRNHEIIGRADADLFVPAEAEPLAAVKREVLATGDGRRVEATLTLDGEPSVWDLTIEPTRDATGEITGVACAGIDVTARKLGADALARSRARLSGILDIADDAIISVDNDQRVTLFNRGAARIFGYAEREVLGQPLAMLLPERYREIHRRHLETYGETPDNARPMGVRGRIMGRRKNGELFPAEASISKLTIESEVVYTAILRDITQRLQAEQAMRLSEAKFRATFESAATGAAIVDADGRFVEANSALQRMLGWSLDELRSRTFAEITHPDDLDGDLRMYEDLKRGLRDHYRIEKRYIRRDGATIWGRLGVSLVRDPSAQPQFAVKLVEDVTELKEAEARLRSFYDDLEQKIAERTVELTETNERLQGEIDERRRTEAALRRSEAEFRELADAMPQVVWAAGPDGSIDYFNRRFWNSTGLPEEADGSAWDQAVHADDRERVRRRWRASVETGDVFEVEYRFRDAHSGGWRWHLGRALPVRDESGRIVRWFGTSTDIDDAKQAQVALEQRARDLGRSNAELEQFAYVASHDLQEPLRMVASYTQLLAKRYREKFDPEAQEFMHFIVDGATRMQQLIDDLLAFSRVGRRGQEFAPVALDDVIARTLANLRVAIRDSGAEVTHDPLPVVVADGGQLVQLLQNLVGNALKFRHPDTPPRIHLGIVDRGAEWEFSVSDNGIGLDPQYAERIFVIFQRLHGKTEYPGTGIGLAICKKIVERHGGRIWVESQPGHGATFRFTLPRIAQQPHDQESNT